MSVDYSVYLDGLSKEMAHLKDVYSGNIQEEELDHSYQALSQIPVLLKSAISIEMRSFILRQYSEILGNRRDNALATMTRHTFYTFASDMADKEAKYYDELRSISNRIFADLTEYLDDDNREIIENSSSDHELFKSQLADVIKSTIGIPEDRKTGPRDVEEYLAKQNSVNT